MVVCYSQQVSWVIKHPMVRLQIRHQLCKTEILLVYFLQKKFSDHTLSTQINSNELLFSRAYLVTAHILVYSSLDCKFSSNKYYIKHNTQQLYCFIQCYCHYKEGTSQKFCFPDKAFIIILSFITARHILCCSCSIISQNRKQNMYLLTEWESRTGKYLTQNQDVRIESQIFSRPILPNL